MSNSTISIKTLDKRDQPDHIKANECGEMHSDENRGVSCTQRQQQQQQQPQRHANNIHIPLTAASNAGLSSETMSSSSSVVDPLANNPYRDEEKEHYSSSCMLDSVNLHFASMDINDRDSTPDLELSTLCDSNLQSASAGVAAVSDIDGDDVLELGCLDESLLKALKDPQQRLFLLDLDSKFCNFIGNTSRKKPIEFPYLNSYYRMLVHRTANLFKLEHRVDHLQTIIISKTGHSAIPVLRFFHLVEEEEEEEEAAQEQHEIEVVNPIRVLKRCPTRSTNNPCGEGCNNDSTLTSRSTRTIPMEDREKSYAEARARIFQGDTNCDDNHTLSDHESESTEETVDDHPLPANIKTPSVRARQSLHTLLDDTDHSMQQQNKMRSRSLARSASTSSTASSSSGTAMTDISNRSDSTTSSEFHSPGSASGNPSSYCYGSRSTTGYSSAPGYDYFGRNRSSGSMVSSVEQRSRQHRQSFHCDCRYDSMVQNNTACHHQLYMQQQHRYNYDPNHSHGSPVQNDSRYYSASSSPSEGYHASYCMHAHSGNINRPHSYPYHGSNMGQHSYNQHQARGDMNRRVSGVHSQSHQHSGYQHHQHHSPSWSGISPRYDRASSYQQNNVYEYQRSQDSPPHCCESYRTDGGVHFQQGSEQEVQDHYQEDRQGRLEHERYGGGRVTADAMAVGPSPRLFQVSVRPYPSSNGYRPYRQGIQLPPQQQTRPQRQQQQQQQQQHQRGQSRHHHQQHHYHQQQQQHPAQSRPIPIPATRRQGSAQEPQRQSSRVRVAAMSGREEGHQVVYDVDRRPPKSTELYDPYASSGHSTSSTTFDSHSSSIRGRKDTRDLSK